MLRDIKDVLKRPELDRVCNKYKLERLFFSKEGNILLRDALPKKLIRLIDSVKSPIRNFCKGEIVTQIKKLQHLILELVRLKKKLNLEELPPKIRIATILSFWNEYAKILPRRISKLADGMR